MYGTRRVMLDVHPGFLHRWCGGLSKYKSDVLHDGLMTFLKILEASNRPGFLAVSIVAGCGAVQQKRGVSVLLRSIVNARDISIRRFNKEVSYWAMVLSNPISVLLVICVRLAMTIWQDSNLFVLLVKNDFARLCTDYMEVYHRIFQSQLLFHNDKSQGSICLDSLFPMHAACPGNSLDCAVACTPYP